VTAPPAMRNAYPLVLLRSDLSPAQSASTKPIGARPREPLKGHDEGEVWTSALREVHERSDDGPIQVDMPKRSSTAHAYRACDIDKVFLKRSRSILMPRMCRDDEVVDVDDDGDEGGIGAYEQACVRLGLPESKRSQQVD